MSESLVIDGVVMLGAALACVIGAASALGGLAFAIATDAAAGPSIVTTAVVVFAGLTAAGRLMRA